MANKSTLIATKDGTALLQGLSKNALIDLCWSLASDRVWPSLHPRHGRQVKAGRREESLVRFARDIVHVADARQDKVNPLIRALSRQKLSVKDDLSRGLRKS